MVCLSHSNSAKAALILCSAFPSEAAISLRSLVLVRLLAKSKPALKEHWQDLTIGSPRKKCQTRLISRRTTGYVAPMQHDAPPLPPLGRVQLHIDGQQITDLRGFYEEFSLKILGHHRWGKNLDALNDVLRGGFGTPPEGFVLVWTNAALSRERLGADMFEQIVQTIRDHGPGGVDAQDAVDLVLG